MIEKIIVFIYLQGKNKLFNVEMNYGKAEIIAFDTFTAKSVFCIYHDVLCNIWSLYSIKILMQHSNNMRLCNFSNQLLLIQPAAHLPELSILVFLPVFAH